MTSRLPVLLIPGLMAGDWAMIPMRKHLRTLGFPTINARIGLNVGCTTVMLDQLEQRLASVVRHHGRPAAIVGHSRGGTLGKLLTLRRPGDVAGLIALGSPNVDPLGVSRFVEWQLRVLNRLNAAGFSTLLGADCLSGACADSARSELNRDFPADVPYTLVYSKNDGVVDWQACCDPAAELIEVRGSHTHLAIGAEIRRLVAATLDRIESGETAALTARAV